MQLYLRFSATCLGDQQSLSKLRALRCPCVTKTKETRHNHTSVDTLQNIKAAIWELNNVHLIPVLYTVQTHLNCKKQKNTSLLFSHRTQSHTCICVYLQHMGMSVPFFTRKPLENLGLIVTSDAPLFLYTQQYEQLLICYWSP